MGNLFSGPDRLSSDEEREFAWVIINEHYDALQASLATAALAPTNQHTRLPWRENITPWSTTHHWDVLWDVLEHMPLTAWLDFNGELDAKLNDIMDANVTALGVQYNTSWFRTNVHAGRDCDICHRLSLTLPTNLLDSGVGREFWRHRQGRVALLPGGWTAHTGGDVGRTGIGNNRRAYGS